MTTLQKINELISVAINAEQEFTDASEEKDLYSSVATDKKNAATRQWNALHDALGELHKANYSRWNAYGDSKLARLLSHWDSTQIKDGRKTYNKGL